MLLLILTILSSIKANIPLYITIPLLILSYLIYNYINKAKETIKNPNIIMLLLVLITIIIINKNIFDKLYLLLLFSYYISLNLKLDIKDNNKYIRTIIIKKVLENPSKYIKKFYHASINIILVSNNKYKYYKQKETITNKDINKNIIIPKYSIIKPYILDTTLVLEDDKNIDNIYDNIKNSRGKYDNLIRANKIKNILFLSLLLSIIILSIFNFKTDYSLIFITSIISLNLIISYLSLYYPYDTDIMNRKPLYNNNVIKNKEDIFLSIINIITITMSSTIIYMYLIANQASPKESIPYLYISILISNLFTIIYLYSERISIINILNSINKITMLITYLLYFITIYIFIYKPIIITNLLIIIIINIILIFSQDIIKIFRLLTIRKSDNYDKNNK